MTCILLIPLHKLYKHYRGVLLREYSENVVLARLHKGTEKDINCLNPWPKLCSCNNGYPVILPIFLTLRTMLLPLIQDKLLASSNSPSLKWQETLWAVMENVTCQKHGKSDHYILGWIRVTLNNILVNFPQHSQWSRWWMVSEMYWRSREWRRQL